MAVGSSAVAANAPPIAVALAPCSKREKPEPNAAPLTSSDAAMMSSHNLREERKVDLLSRSNCEESSGTGDAAHHTLCAHEKSGLRAPVACRRRRRRRGVVPPARFVGH